MGIVLQTRPGDQNRPQRDDVVQDAWDIWPSIKPLQNLGHRAWVRGTDRQIDRLIDLQTDTDRQTQRLRETNRQRALPTDDDDDDAQMIKVVMKEVVPKKAKKTGDARCEVY